MSNLFCRRGFNIDSLTVSATNDPAVSRITVTITSDDKALKQLILQTERMAWPSAAVVYHTTQGNAARAFSEGTAETV